MFWNNSLLTLVYMFLYGLYRPEQFEMDDRLHILTLFMISESTALLVLKILNGGGLSL